MSSLRAPPSRCSFPGGKSSQIDLRRMGAGDSTRIGACGLNGWKHCPQRFSWHGHAQWEHLSMGVGRRQVWQSATSRTKRARRNATGWETTCKQERDRTRDTGEAAYMLPKVTRILWVPQHRRNLFMNHLWHRLCRNARYNMRYNSCFHSSRLIVPFLLSHEIIVADYHRTETRVSDTASLHGWALTTVLHLFSHLFS